MGKFLLLVTFLGSLSSEYEKASDTARLALFETELVKKEMIDFERDAHNRIYKYTGISKDELIYAGYAYPILTGKISTKPFKKFKYTTEDGFTFRPELEYKYNDNEYTLKIILVKEF